MSVCAGSLTKAFRVFPGADFQVRLLRRRGTARVARLAFSSISPARSGWIAPGRIGFMSTQRRENRSTPATKRFRGEGWFVSNPAVHHDRGRLRNASRPAGRLERDGQNQNSMAQFKQVRATGNAAPPVDLAFHHTEELISLGTPAATSLQSDCCNNTLAGLAPLGARRGQPPLGARCHDTRSLHLRPSGVPNQSHLSILRVSIRPCRVCRQH